MPALEKTFAKRIVKIVAVKSLVPILNQIQHMQFLEQCPVIQEGKEQESKVEDMTVQDSSIILSGETFFIILHRIEMHQV